MTAKRSFIIILRIFFVLFSLQFVKDAFYKWDGYSYYMRFTDFLPDLSLAFILWTIFGVIFALAFWVIMYGLPKILPKPLKVIRFEHIIVFFILVVFPVFIKRTFFGHISFDALIGLSDLTALIIAGVLVAVAIWFGRRYVEKILYGFDSRITPLVWFFVLLLILAVPFSMFTPLEKIFLTGFTKESPEAQYIPDNVPHNTSKKIGEGSYSDSSLGIELQRRTDRPNIILVTMDALNARNMQVYGYHRPTTPFISEWAKDAIVFNRAYSASNWTGATTMTLMTGQRPWTHKVWYQAKFHPPDKYEDNLPMVLKDYGYAVYGFVQNEYAHPETLGIKEAFLVKDKAHTFWIPKWWWVDKLAEFFAIRPIVGEWIFIINPIAKTLNLNAELLNLKFFGDPRYASLVLVETVYNRFLEYISQNTEQPFFTWIHVYPPHLPYLPPEPYMGMFEDAEKFNTGYRAEKQKHIDVLIKRYDEFILYCDQQFKLFLSRLAETIDMSNTIIILSSDHGESPERGIGHGTQYYESQFHIPLIIKMPVEIDFRKRVSVRVDSDVSTYRGKINGRVINMPVEQVDIAPTILELAGIPVPAWMEGRSLLPLLKGKSLKPRPVFSMQLIENRVIGNYPITKGTIAVWDGDYKLIYYLSETRSEEDKKKLLFNLRADPDETKNIFNEKPEITQRLTKLIEDNLFRANKRITQSNEK